MNDSRPPYRVSRVDDPAARNFVAPGSAPIVRRVEVPAPSDAQLTPALAV